MPACNMKKNLLDSDHQAIEQHLWCSHNRVLTRARTFYQRSYRVDKLIPLVLFSQNNRRILYQSYSFSYLFSKSINNNKFSLLKQLCLEFNNEDGYIVTNYTFDIFCINFIFKMKAKQLLSDKDLQLIKVTYRTVIENYYQNSSEQNVTQILLLNALTTQSISTKDQSDSLLLISMLEIMKVKAKSNKQLCQSIQNLIIHLKNPFKAYLKDTTIQECLDRIEIYPMCCTIINRFYDQEMKPKSDSYNWKQIIIRVSKNSDKNMPIALQTLIMLLPNYSSYAKEVSKSGMIKYLCSVFLLQALNDKYILYRSLKVFKMVAQNDRSVLPGRQKNIALVIYKHPAYILIVQEISQACLQQQYTLKVLANPKDIDPIYVWSYNSNFSSQASQRTIDDLEQILRDGGKGIPADLQWKVYSTINNLVKAKNLRISESWKIPINSEKNLSSYLKLVITVIQKNRNEFFKCIDMKAIDYVYDKSKVSDNLTAKLLKDLKNLDPQLSGKTVGKLANSLLQNFSVDQNPQILMEKASKVPRNNEELSEIEQILNINAKSKDQLQNDIIKTLKNKVLQSLKTAITQKYNINLADVFNNINLNSIDPEVLNKLVKLGQLYLTRDPDQSQKFSVNKFLQIMQWLQDNHGDSIIDWVAASQILAIIFGPDQWEKHISEIPNRCFWLLNSVDCDSTSNLFAKINSIPQNHPKIPLVVGYISKNGDQGLKKLLLKSKILETVISQICNYKNPRVSVKSSRNEGQGSESEQMKKHLKNVLNLSYYIYKWDKSDIRKQIQEKVIKPCLQNILRFFHGTQQQLRFIQNCLPYKVNINDLKDINLQKLLQRHGKLTSHLHKNKFKEKIQFGKISTISSETDANKVEEILKFLEQNPDMIEGDDLLDLLDKMIKNAKKQEKYWGMYPHYMSILNHIVDIATTSDNPEILQKLTEIIERLINGTAQNQDITPQQLAELYENINRGLQKLLDRNIKIEAKRLKIEAQKIQDPQWKKTIIETLKRLEESYRVKVEKVNKVEQPTKVIINIDTIQKQPEQVENKYSSIPINTSPKVSNMGTNKTQEVRIEPSVIKSEINSNQKVNVSNLQINFNVSEEQKKDENIFQGPIDTNDFIQKQQTNNQSPEQQRLLDALKMLKKIIMKQEPKQTFPKLIQIFMTSDFNKNRRYILGHLLTQYYQVIEKDPKVIALLQLKQKTNLCKQICYKFLSKFQEVFIISKRWKLMGIEFIDLAMERVKCTNQNKMICIENGCQIAEYNLIKNNELNYFETKKYHQLAAQLLPKIQQKNEAMYYFLLIGTSARIQGIKTVYISNKLHTKLLDYVNRPDWMSDQKISANLSFALSSLVYTQTHISIQVASKKSQMMKLMDSYRVFATKKPVVESGCSLLSNICYSNKETKELLFNYGIVQLLVELLSKNLPKPEVSTHKQIMRTLGNISLHKPSAQKLINSKICHLIIEMIEKFNILIYRDEQKLKVLKLTVDFFSNIASHKYNLEKMHEQGVTNFVVTILETTQITEDQVLMACIDTIDGLCQNQLIQNYVVMDKKMLLQLIDLLKIKQDQKLITKSIRLLTNMTLNEVCIPYILQANLLSVLANIVLSVYRNQKIDTYINKIVIRIFQRKPDLKLVLKSGYLDCLIKSIEISTEVDDNYIDILLYYCQYIPNYLNHRAFFNIVKVLTSKQNQRETVEKCFKVIRAIFSSQQREDDDILIEGSSGMYDKLLTNNQANRVDIAYLIGLHCTKSKKFKRQLVLDHCDKKTKTIEQILSMAKDEASKQLVFSVMFTIMNKDRLLVDVGQEIIKEQDFAYKSLFKGFQCKLYRMDGSSKSAKVDIDEVYMIRAYKYPDGEIKKKYTISIRQLRDWQFNFEPNDEVWKTSVFSKERGVFDSKPKIQNCVTLLGSQHWGEFSLINLQFNDLQTKVMFVKAISAMVLSLKG